MKKGSDKMIRGDEDARVPVKTKKIFSFPTLGKTVEAESLAEARKVLSVTD